MSVITKYLRYRLLFTSALLLMLAGCASITTGPPFEQSFNIPGDPDIAGEEYAVISAAIQHHLSVNPSRILVIAQQSENRFGSASPPRNFIENLCTGDKYDLVHYDLDPSTQQAVQDAVSKASHFGSCLALPVPYKLLSEEECGEIFAVDDVGWDRFYERFPGSQGLVMVSRVAFNAERDHAILIVGSQAHYAMGYGGWILLVRQEGRWVVVSEYQLWVS